MPELAEQIAGAGIRSYNLWCHQVGWTPITGWRARKKGWIETVNICGRPYITDEAILKFKRRAESGEFAQEHKTPRTQLAAA